MYNPTVSEMRQAWEVAYGDMGAYLLIGAMFVNLEDSAKENLYKQALEKVRADMEENEQALGKVRADMEEKEIV